MTVVAQPTKQTSIYSASFTFSFSFRLLAEDDLVVLHVDQSDPVVVRTLLLSTDYTVSASPWPMGGTITITAGDQPNFTVGDTVIIHRRSELKQATDYIENDRFPAETHEQTVDISRMIEQELDEKASRALAYPIDLAVGAKYDALSRGISNVLDPVDDQDAATKKYINETFFDLPGVLAGPVGPQFLGLVGPDIGDANKTLTVGVDKAFQLWSTELTANRTVTLSTAFAYEGAEFNIVRIGLGDFTLDVGGLKTVLSSSLGTYTRVKYNGSAWILVAYGKFDGSASYNLTQLEIDGGLTINDIIDDSYHPGHVFRYGGIADSALGLPGTDNTLAFQRAVDSGHPAYAPPGYYAIEGTVFIISDGSLQGGKTFKMTANTRLERFGASVEPILHTVGEQNNVDGGGGILAIRSHGGMVKGLLLWGTDPSETDFTSDTSRVSKFSGIRNFKIIGKLSNTGWDGSVGFFAESSGRFRGDFTSPVHFNPYYSSIENIHAQQFDFPFHIGTDVNAVSWIGCSSLQWGHAAFSINGYGNQFVACKTESPSSQDATERFTWYFGKKNDPFGPETGCDKDAPFVDIIAITNGSPTIIQTASAHGQSTEDKIKIESIVDNGPDGDLETALNEGHFQITVTGADTFTIPLDTSGLTNVWASAGLVRTDFYPLLGARVNQVSAFTESAFLPASINVRLVGHGTPVGAYDVDNFKAVWSRNVVRITGSFSGGLGTGGSSSRDALGEDDVITPVIRAERAGIVDFHGFQFRRLDDDSASSFGTDEYKIFTGRIAGFGESLVLDLIEHDNVGPTAAGSQFKLSFIGKEEANQDIHCGEISWLCPVTGGVAKIPVKYKDFQANENDENVTWGVAFAAGTQSNSGKFTLQLTTGNPAGDGEFDYTWKLEIMTSELEKIGGIDWDADISWKNGV